MRLGCRLDEYRKREMLVVGITTEFIGENNLSFIPIA
jgi:hypothetical protein